MECFELPSSSPVMAFSSSGQVPLPSARPRNAAAGPSSRRLDTTSRGQRVPSTSTASASGSTSRSSRLLDALDSLSNSQSQTYDSQTLDVDEVPRKKRRKEDAPDQAALKQAQKAEEKAAKQAQRDAEKTRKKNEKAAMMATKKDWTEANKLRRSKTETFHEMVVDIDGAMVAPAAPSPPNSSTAATPSFAGVLYGAGIEALKTRLHEEGATANVVGSTEPRGASAMHPLSSALGIATPLPDFPVIRLRRKIKARLDVEHRIWVPLAAPTMQHEPTAIIVLSATEVLAHLAQGTGALAQMIPRVKASLASSGGVHSSQAFQLFFIVVGLQIHFRKVAQKSDTSYRKAVQVGLARRNDDEGGADVAEASSSTAAGRKRKAPAEPYAHVDQEQAELELLRLTMEHGVYVIHSKAMVEAVESVVDIVGEVGIRPYKMIANSHLPFCTDSVRTRTVAGEEAVYLSMLQQIPRVTEPAARAIQEEYPTMRSLMEAYDGALEQDRRRAPSTSNRTTASVTDDLLAECVIRSRVDGKASTRKVGKAMSKRIAFVLNHDDPLALV